MIFIVATAVALLVNYPDAREQRERLTAHGAAAMMMVTTVFAAGVFTGILTKSGMLGAMSSDLVRVLPDAVLAHLPVVVGAGVDAAEPGVRSRLVLLRPAAGAGAGLGGGGRLGDRGRTRRDSRPDDDRASRSAR